VSLTQYYTATTLDGFVADADNSLEWLFTRERQQDGPLNYGEFIAGGVEMAVRHPVLGLHTPGAAGRPRLGNRVHERGRRNCARGDGRRRR
jgi:hypothetical protein